MTCRMYTPKWKRKPSPLQTACVAALAGDRCAAPSLNLKWKLWKSTINLRISAQVVKALPRKSVAFMFRFQPPTTIFYSYSSVNVIDLIVSFTFQLISFVAYFMSKMDTGIIIITTCEARPSSRLIRNDFCRLGNKCPKCKFIFRFLWLSYTDPGFRNPTTWKD